jgi:hypothetical protein
MELEHRGGWGVSLARDRPPASTRPASSIDVNLAFTPKYQLELCLSWLHQHLRTLNALHEFSDRDEPGEC